MSEEGEYYCNRCNISQYPEVEAVRIKSKITTPLGLNSNHVFHTYPTPILLLNLNLKEHSVHWKIEVWRLQIILKKKEQVNLWKGIGGHDIMKAPPTRRVKTCKYCLDFHGNPKLIMPKNQHLAKRMPSGDYICLNIYRIRSIGIHLVWSWLTIYYLSNVKIAIVTSWWVYDNKRRYDSNKD
jgi:hypothetical protein